MQSDQQYFPQKPGIPLADQVGSGCKHNAPISSFFGGTILSPGANHFPSFHNVDFQPSKVCPRNFVIFDRTDNRSQIMYHPATAPKFCYPGLNVGASYFQDTLKKNDVNDEREVSSSLKEDSADIDALLSLEEEEEEGDDDDDEEVSTARTNGNRGIDSADSCSSKHRKSRSSSSSQKFTSSGGERKRQKMKKMVKALRGIVPGGNQMNTVTVLDEAVRYLKSLKVEVQKFGIENLKN